EDLVEGRKRSARDADDVDQARVAVALLQEDLGRGLEELLRAKFAAHSQLDLASSAESTLPGRAFPGGHVPCGALVIRVRSESRLPRPGVPATLPPPGPPRATTTRRMDPAPPRRPRRCQRRIPGQERTTEAPAAPQESRTGACRPSARRPRRPAGSAGGCPGPGTPAGLATGRPEGAAARPAAA